MKSIILCKSIHLGNTKKIADIIADRLGCEVLEPESFDIYKFAEYDLIGFGSGIYSAKHHPDLFDLVDRADDFQGKKVFVFSTAAIISVKDHMALNSKLREKNAVIAGEYFSKGWNKNSFMKFFGGMNKGRPNEEDFERAKKFADKLKEEM